MSLINRKYLIHTIFFVGLCLRLIYPEIFEYKDDERIMFEYSQSPFFSLNHFGMPSGVYLSNPPASVWPFQILAKILSIETPQMLNLAVCFSNATALLLLYYFSRSAITRLSITMMSVNPILILYHRKIWAQSILTPFLCIIFWMFNSRKTHPLYAFFLGLFCVLIGQIHMSGFFLFFSVTYFIYFFDADFCKNVRLVFAYSMGVLLGLIPMLPWLFYAFESSQKMLPILGEYENSLQLKAFLFLLTTPFGLHLGNFLGVHLSNSAFAQILPFARFPENTHLAGICMIFGGCFFLYNLWILGMRIVSIIKTHTSTAILKLPAFIIPGMLAFLLDVSTLLVRRYYLLVAMPYDHSLWIQNILKPNPSIGVRHFKIQKTLLLIFLFSQMTLSILLIIYLKKNQGAPFGDFGKIISTT